MFEIHVGELRATFLRNHNMRRRKDPKRKAAQAEDNSSPEDSPSRRQLKLRKRPHPRQPPQLPEAQGHYTRYGALHPLRGAAPDQGRCTRYVAVHPLRGGAPVTWRCTRYVALHPLRGGAPEQKRCIAYGSGAAPQQTRTNAELAHRTTHRRTPPCATGPYWRQEPPTLPTPPTPPTPPPALRPTPTPALRPTPTPPTPLHAKSQ